MNDSFTAKFNFNNGKKKSNDDQLDNYTMKNNYRSAKSQPTFPKNKQIFQNISDRKFNQQDKPVGLCSPHLGFLSAGVNRAPKTPRLVGENQEILDEVRYLEETIDASFIKTNLVGKYPSTCLAFKKCFFVKDSLKLLQDDAFQGITVLRLIKCNISGDDLCLLLLALPETLANLELNGINWNHERVKLRLFCFYFLKDLKELYLKRIGIEESDEMDIYVENWVFYKQLKAFSPSKENHYSIRLFL